MIQWTIVSGVGAKFTVTVRGTNGQAIALTGSENFICKYWSGETQQQIGTLSWAYNDLAAGTVDITVSSAVASADLGLYQWVLELPDASAAYARGSFEIVAGPGAATFTTTPYCTYTDVLNYAPWVKYLSQADSDVQGFLDKRIMARNWLDQVICRSWRGTSQAYFGDAGRSAQFWLGGWVRRSPNMSQWLWDLLQGTNVGGGNPNNYQVLMIRPWVTRVCAYRTIEYIGMGQIGINNQYAVYGRIFASMADSEVCCFNADLDLNQDGRADLSVPLSATNTLFT